ncbi:DNA sulfur modification protein DndB [Microcoleus sp.]|jgi:DNA sulfur modification protein DndB|uniref:DNA sulfur modification protein DndB n=1 Tax=Microcoleus sp. TaxID=44472 RepID=UPI0035946B58
MPNDSSNQPELNQRLDEFLEPYFAKYHRKKCYPGLIFQHGKRKMVQFNVPADDLPTLLQAKPSTNNEPESGKNRPEIKGHAEEVKDYILKRVRKDQPWIVGTLTANVDPEKIEIIELSRGICLVVIPRGVKLDITDGQHRKRAIHELIESANGELIGDNDFPITLVLEGDLNQCQRDFRDMAQTKALDKSLLLSFGEMEGRIGICKQLIEQVPIFQGKTEKVKGSPSSKEKRIYTMNYVAKAVSCAFANDPNNELKDCNLSECSAAIISCLNQFFTECSLTQYIYETEADDLTVNEIDNFKESCLLGRSVGIEILGKLLYCTYDADSYCFDPERVSELAQLDWSRKSHIWEGNVVLSNSNLNNPRASYKITASASAVKMAIEAAKAELGWI